MSRLNPVLKALEAVTSRFYDELSLAYGCLKTLKPMCGLASIPNDVMVVIFELAVAVNPNESRFEHFYSQRARAVLHLSHISQHFRNFVCSLPQLWNKINIHPNSPSRLTQACIQWSQGSALDIHLSVFHDNPGRGEYFDSIHQVLSQAHRWRKVTLHVYPKRRTSPERAIFDWGLKWEARNGCELEPVTIKSPLANEAMDQMFQTPLLQELSIQKEFGLQRSVLENLGSDFSWCTPKLKILKVSHYFPYDLPAIPSITTLDITIGRDKFDFYRLLRTLPRMRALDDLRLHFISYHDPHTDGEVVFDPIVLENVARLSVRLETRWLIKPERASSQSAFFAALHFPNASELHIKCYRLHTGQDIQRSSSFFDDFLKLAEVQFPTIFTLRLEFHGKKHPCHLVERIVLPQIPLHQLRKLGNLHIQCNVPLSIEIDSIYGSADRPLPPLRNLSLHIGKDQRYMKSNLRPWVRNCVYRLQSQGIWERFVELDIRKTTYSEVHPEIELEATEERIPRDRVLGWCQTVRISFFCYLRVVNHYGQLQKA